MHHTGPLSYPQTPYCPFTHHHATIPQPRPQQSHASSHGNSLAGHQDLNMLNLQTPVHTQFKYRQQHSSSTPLIRSSTTELDSPIQNNFQYRLKASFIRRNLRIFQTIIHQLHN